MTVPLPSGAAGASAAEILAGVRGWITAPAMRDLVGEFGGRLTGATTRELLNHLAEFSSATWDFRRRTAVDERHHVPGQEFTDAQITAVRAAASDLGLDRTAGPVQPAYEHVIVLGGRVSACLRRMAHVEELIRDGVGTARIAALGSLRLLDEQERSLLTDAGPATYEVDALRIAADNVFGAAPVIPVKVLAAPVGPGRRRANTADTYLFWAQSARPAAGDRILVVTSRLYVPFQHCDALRVLRHLGCTLETVGVPATAPPPIDRCLQEIHSTIRAMRKLVTALDDGRDTPT